MALFMRTRRALEVVYVGRRRRRAARRQRTAAFAATARPTPHCAEPGRARAGIACLGRMGADRPQQCAPGVDRHLRHGFPSSARCWRAPMATGALSCRGARPGRWANGTQCAPGRARAPRDGRMKCRAAPAVRSAGPALRATLSGVCRMSSAFDRIAEGALRARWPPASSMRCPAVAGRSTWRRPARACRSPHGQPHPQECRLSSARTRKAPRRARGRRPARAAPALRRCRYISSEAAASRAAWNQYVPRILRRFGADR